jgi:NitT/TauT family transport system ATP-binding protein
MIQVRSLQFAYPEKKPIFHDFSWNVDQGETWAILGPSGCGKTTLLYLLAGLIQPNFGQILIHNELLIRPRPSTGLILQDYGLLPWATVRENANLGIQVRRFYGPDGTHAPSETSPLPMAETWLDRLGLLPFADQYPSQISGGQRQRTAIARTLALQPDLLLMDEPFSSLDAVTRTDLQQLTLELCQEQQITMVLVTHSIEEAASMGKKILVLRLPPNEKPVTFDNPDAGKSGRENSVEYQQFCSQLRNEMEQA